MDDSFAETELQERHCKRMQVNAQLPSMHLKRGSCRVTVLQRIPTAQALRQLVAVFVQTVTSCACLPEKCGGIVSDDEDMCITTTAPCGPTISQFCHQHHVCVSGTPDTSNWLSIQRR